MKNMKLVTLLIGMIGILTTGNALSADTATVDVTAVVQGTCSFDTTTYNLDFGVIDPASGADVTASVDLAFTCSNGTSWTLTDVNGVQTMSDGTNNLTYNIAQTATTGTGSGSTQNVTLDGTIAVADFSTATPSLYTDTLTIDITP